MLLEKQGDRGGLIVMKTLLSDFLEVLNSIIDEEFPNTQRFIISGGDYMKDVVMELREGDRKMRYSPYDMYMNSSDCEKTIEEFVKRWEAILK